MTKTFTPNDVILYLYGELNETDKKDFVEALITDDVLREEYERLRAVSKNLDRIDLKPSPNTITRILNYSKSLNSHSF